MGYERPGNTSAARGESEPNFTASWLAERTQKEQEIEADGELLAAFQMETARQLVVMNEYAQARKMFEAILARAEEEDDTATIAEAKDALDDLPTFH